MSNHYFHKLVDSLLNVAVTTFGQKVSYYPSSKKKWFTLTAVFDSEFTQIDPQTEVKISVNRPRIGCKLKDIPGEPEQGDRVKIEGVEFKVNEIQEDGQGGVVLWLTKLDEQAA